MATVIALFEDQARADQAVTSFYERGIAPESMGVLASQERYGHHYEGDGFDPEESEAIDEAGKGMAGGAVGGAVAGGTAGLLASAGLVAIPGIGPLLAGGVLASTLLGSGAGAAIGGATGGILGAIVGATEDDEDGEDRQIRADNDPDNLYRNSMEEGSLLVAVETTDAEAESVAQEMRELGADQVEVHLL
ncbi:MAG TPA: hypothetical protein VHL52_14990 [Acidimicrobiia bacterium]|nr:hypothetical protein [Acidimicrobiia bacterium]